MNEKISTWISVIFSCLLLMAALVVGRLYEHQFLRAEHYWNHARARQEMTIKKTPIRGKIFDRTNQELASAEMVPSLYIAPTRIPDHYKQEFARELASGLGLDYDSIYSRIAYRRGDSVLMRRVDPDTVNRALLLVEAFRNQHKPSKETSGVARNAIYLLEENKRIYPRGDFACHVIGYTQLDSTGDNLGVAGVEKSYDDLLRGKETQQRVQRSGNNVPVTPADKSLVDSAYGKNVVLTIDSRIQQVTENALRKQVIALAADAGVAVVYAVKTGEVLAMASVPSFDLTNISGAPTFALRNRAIADAIEPGSVMKIFTYASLLEEDKLRSLQEIVDCSGGRWVVAGRSIVDAHAMGAVPIVKAFAESSNVAAAKLAMSRLQPQRFYKHLVDFGFGEKTGIDLPGEAPGLLRHVKEWTAQSIASLAYGYELQVTAIQMVAAVAAIANNGKYMKPHVVKEIRDFRGELVTEIQPEYVRTVCSPDTTRRMLELMEAVVVEGTGKAAAVPGYRVGGKTGTTIKLDPETRRYSRGSYIGSFCGVIPLEDPQLCLYIWIDNPRGGQYYGGQVAAPVFKEIATAAVKVLNIPPSGAAPAPPVRSLDVAKTQPISPPRTAVAADPVPEIESAAPNSMPDLRGLTIREAHERLAQLNLPFEAKGSGVVIDQIPRPYETIEPGETVLLVLGSSEHAEQLVAEASASPPRLGADASGGAWPQTEEAPVIKIVNNKRGIEIPISASARANTGESVAMGLPRPERPSPKLSPEEPVEDEPDPRVRRGPLPDAGRTVWKKVMEETLQPAAGSTRNSGELELDSAPSSKPPGAALRRAYEIRQISHEVELQESGAER